MDTIKGLNITDHFLKEIPLIWSKINFEQQLTSKDSFMNKTYGSTPWCESTMPPFTIEMGMQRYQENKTPERQQWQFLTLQELQNKNDLKIQPFDLAVVFFLLLNHSGEEVSYMDILDMSNRSTVYTYTTNQSLPKKCTSLNGIVTELKLSFFHIPLIISFE